MTYPYQPILVCTMVFYVFFMYACIVAVATSFQGSYTTREYVPPQSVGGGMMSPGGYQEVQHTYHAPHSVGGGMMHHGGWEHTPIVQENPWRQPIINFFSATANGHSSNNYRRNLPP